MTTKLIARIDVFMNKYLPNPAVKLDFIRIVEDVLQHPRADHADYDLQEYIDTKEEALQRYSKQEINLIGDIITEDGTVYEVVWAGGDGLLPDRETKPNEFWTPPKRLYNKKSPYWTRNTVDKPVPQVDNLTGDDNED